jgi:conjugal transfer pilus assembly protein TraW
MDVMLLLTEGPYRSLVKELGVSLFYADSRLSGRFSLSAVPSVIRQEGRVMVVREIAVPRTERPDKHSGTRPADRRGEK